MPATRTSHRNDLLRVCDCRHHSAEWVRWLEMISSHQLDRDGALLDDADPIADRHSPLLEKTLLDLKGADVGRV